MVESHVSVNTGFYYMATIVLYACSNWLLKCGVRQMQTAD